MKKGFYLLTILIITFSSCIPKKSYYYFQKSGITPIKDSLFTKINAKPAPEHFLAANDLLEIRIEEANLVSKNEGSTDKSPTVPTYSVNSKGFITLPLIGFFSVAGKTCSELHDTLLAAYRKYYRDPYVSVALKSFRVNVLGEVKLPGLKILEGEHASIIDAIGMSSDLTDDGKRINVKIFRRISENQFQQITIDLSSIEVFNSDGFYLQSNDIIYVSAINSKRKLARSNALTLGVTLLNSFMILYRTF